MKILINSRQGMGRLRDGLRDCGHEVVEDLWDLDAIIASQVAAVVFEFRTIFNRKWRFWWLALRLRKAGIPVVTWNLDAPWHMNRSRTRVNLLLRSGILSLYATHSLQDTAWVKRTKVLYLPNAAYVQVYNLQGRTIEELAAKQDYRYDVSFIGNMNENAHPEHRRRAAFLAQLSQFLQPRQISYLFVDTGKTALGAAEQIDIIQNSRINLSCVAAADSTGIDSWGMTERSFGVPACGGFLLSEERVHLQDNFDLGSETATYRDLEDCLSKIRYYLEHEAERKQIMVNAHRRVLSEHTYRDRARTFVESISVV